jgi:serine/threonine protein kinase
MKQFFQYLRSRYISNIFSKIILVSQSDAELVAVFAQMQKTSDRKPDNILMNSKQEGKLSDFGISKELQKTAALCNTFVAQTCLLKEYWELHIPIEEMCGVFGLVINIS